MDLMGIPQGVQTSSPSAYCPPTITARLKRQKEVLEQQLAKVNEVLSALAVAAISRVGNY